MQLIVVREARDSSAEGRTGLLRYALSTAPLHGVVLDGLAYLWRCQTGPAAAEWMGWTQPNDLLWALPQSWQADLPAAPGHTVFDGDSLSLAAGDLERSGRGSWIVITNGRFAACVNHALLGRLPEVTNADIIAVTAAPDLRACQENVRLTQENKVVGYRRLYADSMSLRPVPADWPHHLLVRREAFGTALQSDLLSIFGTWAGRCRTEGLRLQGVAVAGSAYDLESQEGVLAVCRAALGRSSSPDAAMRSAVGQPHLPPGNDGNISPDSRRIGPVLFGKQVTVQAGAVIVGPAVLCDGSTVGRDAVIDSSIVGAGVSVEPNRLLRGRVVTASRRGHAAEPGIAPTGRSAEEPVGPAHQGVFRTWPRFSYARCLKRIADVAAAILVLILFAPVIPVIALAVKINSRGPVFFRDKRQGLHGKPFRCIKFRTMRSGADKMQDKLRFVSEVDGPQFKMADDPRITTVGRFLRETYLDEIPQFFHVLCGQMSVVGPRPSPELENTLCPSWRDARLSVRPGITGLWQVRRTREPLKDFQEWIHYDTQYVRDFSLGLDLWICWRTFTRMVGNFVSQF